MQSRGPTLREGIWQDWNRKILIAIMSTALYLACSIAFFEFSILAVEALCGETYAPWFVLTGHGPIQ